MNEYEYPEAEHDRGFCREHPREFDEPQESGHAQGEESPTLPTDLDWPLRSRRALYRAPERSDHSAINSRLVGWNRGAPRLEVGASIADWAPGRDFLREAGS